MSRSLRGKLCEELTSGATRVIPAGQFIYYAGDLAYSIYFLRSGLVKSSVLSQTGEELILRLYKPGEIFGELCFCEGRRLEQAVCMAESGVVEIDFNALIDHLQLNRQALLDFLQVISLHLSEAYDQLRTFSFDETTTRLVNKLLQLAAEFGEPTADGVEIKQYIKQEELAQMIASRREVVSTLLNRLREIGLLRYSRKGRLKFSGGLP
ncbi:Crp/Fnr family transcriptional regulator [bacterium]|nr:Crp/Fnr family transcriptional regulator [bacterium]